MFGQKLACGDDVEELEELLDEKSRYTTKRFVSIETCIPGLQCHHTRRLISDSFNRLLFL
jgi:hypothetical protein